MSDACYIVREGDLRVTREHSDGRAIALATLGRGDIFGELALFGQAERSADATSIEDAELLSLDAGSLNAAIAAHPQIATALLHVLGQRLRQSNEAFQDIAFFDVPGRVARRLADLADAHGVEAREGVMIDIALSQESLAQMVGATRESVNKALALLKRRGLVARVGRRYIVSDVERLRGRAR
jgi:CRP/FNR family transcriptional regulator